MKTSVPISALLHHKGATVFSVAPDSTVFDAIKLMAEKNIGALLVMTHSTLVGVFTERDYARKIALHGKSSKETLVKEILSRNVVTAAPADSIEDCMRMMTENRVRHLPVLQNEEVVGIVSIGDLVNYIISAQDATIAQMEQYIAGGIAA
jgi:CBS domain-containing protein